MEPLINKMSTVIRLKHTILDLFVLVCVNEIQLKEFVTSSQTLQLTNYPSLLTNKVFFLKEMTVFNSSPPTFSRDKHQKCFGRFDLEKQIFIFPFDDFQLTTIYVFDVLLVSFTNK